VKKKLKCRARNDLDRSILTGDISYLILPSRICRIRKGYFNLTATQAVRIFFFNFFYFSEAKNRPEEILKHFGILSELVGGCLCSGQVQIAEIYI